MKTSHEARLIANKIAELVKQPAPAKLNVDVKGLSKEQADKKIQLAINKQKAIKNANKIAKHTKLKMIFNLLNKSK